jgi:hypothetical protein
MFSDSFTVEDRSEIVIGAEYGFLYTNLIPMCVESSAMIVIFGGIYIALAFTQRRPAAYS